MWEGKKGLAQAIFYDGLKKAAANTKKEPLELFNAALENIGPTIELKVRRVAGANYQVPTEVNEERKVTLALRWLVTYARARNEKNMVDRSAGELVDAYNGTGGSIKKKEDTK